MLTIYTAGFILYCLSVFLIYSVGFKASPWFIPTGLVISIAINYLWLYISKTTIDKHVLYLRGIYWDGIIVLCYTLIPVLLFGVRFKVTTAIGVALVIAGMIITKL